jgi:hypothetical protein
MVGNPMFKTLLKFIKITNILALSSDGEINFFLLVGIQTENHSS